MKSRIFEVPTELIYEFSEALEENELFASIEGVTEDDEIIVEVEYEANERNAIHKLLDMIDDYNEENEEEEEDDDDE